MTTKHASIRLELLLGTRVVDVNGEKVGRIEEIAATVHDGEMLVDGYIVGRYGLAARMSFGSSLRWLVRMLGMNAEKGHFIPWDKLDLSHPDSPRTTCPKEELKHRPS